MPNLEFGDRIRVLGQAGIPVDGTGVFLSLQGNMLSWVGLDTVAGVTLFLTNIEGHTIIRV